VLPPGIRSGWTPAKAAARGHGTTMERGEAATAAPGAEPGSLRLDDFHSADVAMQKCLDLARLAGRPHLPILIVGRVGDEQDPLGPSHPQLVETDRRPVRRLQRGSAQ